MIKKEAGWAFIFLMLSATDVPAQLLSKKEVLLGLKEGRVVIELNPATINAGLSMDQLRTDVESRLHRNGIMVDENSSTVIYVNVTSIEIITVTGMSLGLSVFPKIELNEMVELVRAPSKYTFATTWESGLLNIFPDRNSFVQGARQMVEDLVDRFCNAYLAANRR